MDCGADFSYRVFECLILANSNKHLETGEAIIEYGIKYVKPHNIDYVVEKIIYCDVENWMLALLNHAPEIPDYIIFQALQGSIRKKYKKAIQILIERGINLELLRPDDRNKLDKLLKKKQKTNRAPSLAEGARLGNLKEADA
jgi:hypothetical protein